MKSKVILSSVAKSNNNVVYAEYRYDANAICVGLFVTVENNMAETIEETEVSYESTAKSIFDSFVNRY